MTSIARRETRSCSRPSASRWLISVMGGAELGLGGPADLPLDLLDESFDLGGGAARLLPLDRDERGLVLLVGEVDADRAGGEQRPADQTREDDRVLAEQAPARLHLALTSRR